MTRLSPADRYKRDLEVLDIPASVLRTHMKKAAGKEGEELEALLRGFAETAESIYPYRRGKDPRQLIKQYNQHAVAAVPAFYFACLIAA